MSFNKVIMMGHLGSDPEVRYTKSGDAVATLNIATNERYKDADGNRAERTNWQRAVCFRQKGELCQKYLSKGDPILVEGKLKTNKWTDSEGKNRYSTEVYVDELTFLPRGKQKAEGGTNSAGRLHPEQGAQRDEDVPF